MSYIQVLAEGTRRARMYHQCFDCYRSIAPGDLYAFQTCKYDDVYTIAQHLDCRDLAREYRCDVGLTAYDYDDGLPPLADDWRDSGEHDALCDVYRGRYPHVICRFELSDQLAEIRRTDRLRTLQDPHHAD